MVCYQVNQSFLKAGTSRVGWPGSLPPCVAVTLCSCSLEMDVFDMDVVKALCQALIVQLKKQTNKQTELSVLTHTAPILEPAFS